MCVEMHYAVYTSWVIGLDIPGDNLLSLTLDYGLGFWVIFETEIFMSKCHTNTFPNE